MIAMRLSFDYNRIMSIESFEIPRTLYLEPIGKWIGTPVVKVLTGMRRVGKSVLLRQIAEHARERGSSADRVLLISTERLEFEHIRTYRDLNDAAHQARGASPGGRLTLLVDEVQNIEHWERTAASLVAEGGYDIFLTGSNASLLASDLATRIAGRYVELSVFPLTFAEFVEFRKAAGGATTATSEAGLFRSFMRYGGLPGIHHVAFTDEHIDQYLNGIYSTIILRDVLERNQVRNPRLLEDIGRFLLDSIGVPVSAKRIADYLKSQRRSAAVDTVLDYIGYLERSCASRRARRFDIRGKRRLEVQDKFYLGDIGLRYARMGYRDDDIAPLPRVRSLGRQSGSLRSRFRRGRAGHAPVRSGLLQDGNRRNARARTSTTEVHRRQLPQGGSEPGRPGRWRRGGNSTRQPDGFPPAPCGDLTPGKLRADAHREHDARRLKLAARSGTVRDV